METIHSILLVLNDDDDQTNATRVSLLEQLGQSSRLLISMIEKTMNNYKDDKLDMVRKRYCNFLICIFYLFQSIKTLLMDGVLSLRLRLLTSIMTTNDQKIPYLNDFQQELDCYKQLNRIMKLPKQRVNGIIHNYNDL